MNECHCGSGELKEPQFDAQGFQPEILTDYTQEDVDEPIDEETGFWDEGDYGGEG